MTFNDQYTISTGMALDNLLIIIEPMLMTIKSFFIAIELLLLANDHPDNDPVDPRLKK